MVDVLYPRDMVMERGPTLFTLVGLPGSGKSVWAQQQAYMHSTEYAIISTDYFLERIAKEYRTSYKWAFENKFKEAKQKAMLQAQQAVKDKNHIIWDQTHMTIKSRRRGLSMVTKDYQKIAVIFECDERELLERIDHRKKETGKDIPLQVLMHMARMYVYPTVDEGFDEVYLNTGDEYEETMKRIIRK